MKRYSFKQSELAFNKLKRFKSEIKFYPNIRLIKTKSFNNKISIERQFKLSSTENRLRYFSSRLVELITKSKSNQSENKSFELKSLIKNKKKSTDCEMNKLNNSIHVDSKSNSNQQDVEIVKVIQGCRIQAPNSYFECYRRLFNRKNQKVKRKEIRKKRLF